MAIGDDAGRLAAVRAFAGPEMAIRIDANGAWTARRGRGRAARRSTPVGIELCEEPVRGLAAIGACASSTDVPLALDETAADPDALCTAACRRSCA